MESESVQCRRAILLVLDSLGIGATDDADQFGDVGADTLGHLAERFARHSDTVLDIPNLSALGLVRAHRESTGTDARIAPPSLPARGAWGYARELSSGKDTPSGHWEMAGVPVLFDWGYFPPGEDCFPDSLLKDLVTEADLPGVLGNRHSSGTVIIQQLGSEHMATGKPIVYTSADSVFQIAAHEQAFGLERLYQVCQVARRLVDPYNVGRVIARPFVGDGPESFQRTGNRRDYAVPPPDPTLLDRLVESGGEVISVGKIADIFAHQGISRKIKANGIDGLFDATLSALGQAGDRSLVFTNFVDFDSSFGHRRDPVGYAEALARLDARLPELFSAMAPTDLLVVTADHGCDPTWEGSDHTREHVPVLVSGAGVKPQSLGQRQTFADIGQSLCDFFGLPSMNYGSSFL
ncbi:MAG: phosphopentomutase [Xanthomonadales bacterium]|nr:phosphopentomutase [Xanthomonadales bacterium]